MTNTSTSSLHDDTGTASSPQGTPQFNDFFALFNQPAHFNIDEQALDERYLALQKQYHPDQQHGNIKNDNIKIDSHVNSNIDNDAKNLAAPSEAASALINHAYQTLKSPDTRATYLLESQQQADTLNNSISDLDFLDDAMTLRISLEEAIEANDLALLHELKPQIANRLQAQSQRFEQSYQQQHWTKASDATQKLKFLVKLNADIMAGIDKVANCDDLDDDLYV